MGVSHSFGRAAILDLRAGDIIRYNALFQSRDGMIAREEVRGRIVTITREEVSEGEAPPSVQGTVELESGNVQQFRLTKKDKVYREPDGAQWQTSEPESVNPPPVSGTNRQS